MLVSSCLNIRDSTKMTKFQLPEKEGTLEKQRKFSYSRSSLVLNRNNEIRENVESDFTTDYCQSKISAYELPPILNGEPNSGLINNKNLTSRSNTFHNYQFNNKHDQTNKRYSVHSDSAIQKYSHNCVSETSSAASQKSRGRVLSAGTEPRYYRKSPFTLADLTNGVNKDTERQIPYRAIKYSTGSIATSRNASVAGDKTNYFPPNCKPTLKHSDSESKIANGKKLVERKFSRTISDASLTNYSDTIGINRSIVKHKIVRTINGTKELKSPCSNYNTFGHGDSDEHQERAQIFFSSAESDKDQIVIDWMNGVVDAEPPEEPEIDHQDEPPQRDTAIRIIYDGDS